MENSQQWNNKTHTHVYLRLATDVGNYGKLKECFVKITKFTQWIFLFSYRVFIVPRVNKR